MCAWVWLLQSVFKKCFTQAQRQKAARQQRYCSLPDTEPKLSCVFFKEAERKLQCIEYEVENEEGVCEWEQKRL